MNTLILYQRDGCHLCEQMRAELESPREQHGFELRLCDVDSNPVWRERYGEKVPVLLIDEEEICHYFLDIEALDMALASR